MKEEKSKELIKVVYVDRKHVLIKNKLNKNSAGRIEIKAYLLKGKRKTGKERGVYNVSDFEAGGKVVITSDYQLRTYFVREVKFNTTRQKLVVLFH